MHMAIENSADQQGGGWVFSSLRDARAACGQRPKQELLHGGGPGDAAYRQRCPCVWPHRERPLKLMSASR